MFNSIQVTRNIYKTYIILFIFFFVLFNSHFPGLHNASIQLLMWGMGLLFSIIAFRYSTRLSVCLIFIFNIISIYYSCYINYLDYRDVLGFEPVDADAYRELGQTMGDKDYISMLVAVYLQSGLDDIGFPTIVWLLYKIFGSYGHYALLFFNAVIIAWGSYRLYFLSRYFLDPQYSKIVMLIWGMMPFAVHTAESGLKENFFAFCIISSFLFLYRWKYQKRVLTLIRLVIYIFFVFLFRYASGFSIIIAIVSFWFFNRKFVRNNFALVFVILTVLACISFPIVVNVVASYRRMSYEQLVGISIDKANDSGGMIAYAINALSGLFGPIPTFVSNDIDKLNYITRYSFTPLVKLIISFFFYSHVVRSIDRKDFYTMPIVVFVIINIIMVIFTFFALHVRFQWAHIPLFLMLSVVGMVDYYKKSPHINYYPLYLVVMTVIILVYNFK